MSEKLSLQWNDFQENIKNALGLLRLSTEFTDVTLVCQDGRQIEAHKVILIATSPFFQALLKGNRHSHPLIFMRGMNSDDLNAVVDFLYYGEANIYQENLENFLAIAEEFQLKGLTGSNDQFGSNGAEQLKLKENVSANNLMSISRQQMNSVKAEALSKTASNALVTPTTSVLSPDMQELEETLKTMMETGERITQDGKKQRVKVCKVCGKESRDAIDMKRHIESFHLEGVSIPCDLCNTILRSRTALRFHVSRNHKLN